MQYWDNILYPSFRATIRGEYYSLITPDEIDEECYHLACRAISAFKFPRISTDYETFYAIRETDNTLVEVDPEEDENAIPHAKFINPVGQEEIEIIVAWMKVFWFENQLSNANNFEDLYTDVNIKTYSRANLISKNADLLKTFRNYARDLESRYSRVSEFRKPTLGDINE